ncbi:hypothetical protein BD410DRAFT_334553 [Rickenella mellea]|uniref:Uncharacterized protein n=1 Tax=Rickenella mellea TaxID=50990 RepID=A0A4Y7QKI5_9AGAM|nr:hypothetical protein BD410DRAFT_334553 [Rickenella mellea]
MHPNYDDVVPSSETDESQPNFREFPNNLGAYNHGSEISSPFRGSDRERSDCKSSINMPSESCRFTMKSKRSLRNRDSRRQFLMTDEHISNLLPFNAYCRFCNIWVNLGDQMPYSVGEWNMHKITHVETKHKDSHKDFDYVSTHPLKIKDNVIQFQNQNISNENILQWRRDVPFSDTDIAHGEAHEITGRTTSGSLQPRKAQTIRQKKAQNNVESGAGHIKKIKHAVTSSLRVRRHMRMQALQADPCIGEVYPNKVFCLPCQKWISLRQSFCMWYWSLHTRKDLSSICYSEKSQVCLHCCSASYRICIQPREANAQETIQGQIRSSD